MNLEIVASFMYEVLKRQLNEYLNSNNKETLINSIYNQISTLKDISTNNPKLKDWYDKIVINESIEKLRTNNQNLSIQETINRIGNLRFNSTPTLPPKRYERFEITGGVYMSPELFMKYSRRGRRPQNNNLDSTPPNSLQKPEQIEKTRPATTSPLLKKDQKQDLSTQIQPQNNNLDSTSPHSLQKPEQIEKTHPATIISLPKNDQEQDLSNQIPQNNSNSTLPVSLQSEQIEKTHPAIVISLPKNDQKQDLSSQIVRVPEKFRYPFNAHLTDLEPENWEEWHKKSFGNHLGFIIRYLTTLHKYPLNENEKLILNFFLNFELESTLELHQYHHCKEAIKKALTPLLSNQIDSPHKAKNIRQSLVQQEPLRSVIVNELKEAIHPIIQYLADLQQLNRNDVISQIKKFESVLRRWGLIEMDQQQVFGSQSDPSECLQAIYDFLQEPNDQYSSTIINEVHWQATLNQNESDWKIEDIKKPEQNKRLLESLHKHVKKTYPGNVNDIEIRNNLLQNIIHTGFVKDFKGGEIEDVDSLDETLKQRNQKMKLPLFLISYATKGTLLQNNSVRDNLEQMFADVSYFQGYRVKGQILQRIDVPVKSTTTSFSGTYPEVLFIQPLARFANRQETDSVKIIIPQVISFDNYEYVLSKGSVKSGNQNTGHYTFLTVNSARTSRYADSLSEEDFEISRISLSKKLSQMTNVALLEYQRKDIDHKHRVIKQKLYQGQDHLCYLIQALYFIYGNPSFACLNQTKIIEKSMTSCSNESNHHSPIIDMTQDPASKAKSDKNNHASNRKRKGSSKEPKIATKKTKRDPNLSDDNKMKE